MEYSAGKAIELNAQEVGRRLSRPDVVLMDIDNTLYEYMPAHLAAIKAVERKACQTFAITELNFQQAFEEARKAVKTRLGGTAASHHRALYFQNLFEILGLGSQPLAVLDLEQTYWRTFLGNAVLFEGVEDFLDDLRLLGIPLLFVTDLTSTVQLKKILYFGLEGFPDAIVSSEESGADKPAENSFLLAVEKAGPTGKSFWMVGDDPRADILGARNAIGATTIQKIHRGVKKGRGDQAPDVTFRNFEELRKLLKSSV